MVRGNVIFQNRQTTLFIKELGIYIDYLKNKIEDSKDSMN